MIVRDVKTQKKISQNNKHRVLYLSSACFTDDSRYVVVERNGEAVGAWEVATDKDVAVEDIHRQAVYRLMMRQTGPYTWKEHHMDNRWQTFKRAELVLRRADTYEPIAWLPTPYGGILYSPIAEVWGIRRGGHLASTRKSNSASQTKTL
jgi:hypothetical protein